MVVLSTVRMLSRSGFILSYATIEDTWSVLAGSHAHGPGN